MAEMGNVCGTVKYALEYAVDDAMQMEKLSREMHAQVNRRMIPYINTLAAADYASFHHMYEWRKVGVTAARLFEISRGTANRGKTEIPLILTFRPSKTLVPLTEAQTTPGKTNKTVKRKHKFIAKAYIMEYGIPVKIKPKGSKKLAFEPGKGEGWLIFTRKTVKIKNPGGAATKGAMRLASQQFFRQYGPVVAKGVTTKYIGNLNKNVGARLGRRGKVTIAVPNMNDARREAKAIVRMTNP
jgi:hypothetical protein